MRKAELAVDMRKETGKEAAHRLRSAGKIPAVIYGGDEPPIPISIDRYTMARHIHGEAGENVIFSIKIEGQEGNTLALTKEPQYDPVTDMLVHVDLMRISMDRAIHTVVPLHIMGTPAGVKTGGILEHLLRHVDIRSLPMNVPEAIELNAEHLEIGQSVHVSDIPASGEYEILTDLRTVIALVGAPAKLAAEEAKPEEEEVPAEGEEEAKPEGEEKKPEEQKKEGKGS